MLQQRNKAIVNLEIDKHKISYMYSLFGFEISLNFLIYIIVANFILLALAFIGFTNLKIQIRELKELLSKMEERKNELRGH